MKRLFVVLLIIIVLFTSSCSNNFQPIVLSQNVTIEPDIMSDYALRVRNFPDAQNRVLRYLVEEDIGYFVCDYTPHYLVIDLAKGCVLRSYEKAVEMNDSDLTSFFGYPSYIYLGDESYILSTELCWAVDYYENDLEYPITGEYVY